MAMDDILLEVEEKMESAANYLKTEFRGVRTGRASSGLVEHIKINYYGSPTDLRALASISTPEASLIVIKPFDPNSLKDIERGIQASDLGITPSSDGKVIRLVLPALSMERRQHLTAQIKKMAEAARVTVRNARRDGNKEIEKQETDKELTEDDARKAKEETQKLTEKHEKLITDILAAKTAEIQER
jgi:ribosome recycling factor